MTSESPFSPAIERSAFLETVGGGEVLRRLDAGLGAREPFLLLTGESGTGKTTLVHEAIARWDSRVTAAFLACPTLTGKELLEEIVLRFGAEPADGASRPRLMACLERALTDIANRAQTAVFVVDDAQRLPQESLEELRLLVNGVQQARLSLEILLVGSPELEALIEGPSLAALRERLSVRAKLRPLSQGETRRYLRHRMSVVGDDGTSLFPRKICLEIAAVTGGIPRRINVLAGEALRIARDAGERAITGEHLRAATDTLAGTIRVHAADESDDEERAPLPIPTDALPERMAPAVPSEPSSAHPERSIPPALPHTTHSAGRESARSGSPMPPAEEIALPACSASQDPGEWVSRFVGDQGPIRIGSQAMATSTSAGESEREQPSTLAAARPAAADEAPSTRSPREGPSPRPSNRNDPRLLAYALVAIAMLSAIALVIRAGIRTSGEKRQVAANAATTASGPSVVAASERPRAAVITQPSRSAASDSVPSAGPPVPSPQRRYTLAVGEFIDLQAAFDERDRLHELTGMDTWVVPATNDLEPHRIVLGIYRSQERAQAAAEMLTNSRTLDAATVVPLPKRSARQ